MSETGNRPSKLAPIDELEPMVSRKLVEQNRLDGTK